MDNPLWLQQITLVLPPLCSVEKIEAINLRNHQIMTSIISKLHNGIWRHLVLILKSDRSWNVTLGQGISTLFEVSTIKTLLINSYGTISLRWTISRAYIRTYISEHKMGWDRFIVLGPKVNWPLVGLFGAQKYKHSTKSKLMKIKHFLKPNEILNKLFTWDSLTLTWEEYFSKYPITKKLAKNEATPNSTSQLNGSG